MKFFFLLFLLNSFQLILAQGPELIVTYLRKTPELPNHIVYDTRRPLSMADFKGKPDESNDAVAITSSGFQYRASYHRSGTKSILRVNVFCGFDPAKSWMKEKGLDGDILSHEQLHFDQTYLHLLFFVQRLRQIRFGDQGFMEQIREQYDVVVKELVLRQSQYDRETGHGTRRDEQQIWKRRIRNDMNVMLHRERLFAAD